jgi:hypothetical protein
MGLEVPIPAMVEFFGASEDGLSGVKRFYGYENDAKWFDRLNQNYYTVGVIKRMSRTKAVKWKRGWPYINGRPLVYVETKWQE